MKFRDGIKHINRLQDSLVGEKFTALMDKSGETKSSLSRKSGITYQTLWYWEKGKAKPTFETALKIGRLLGIV
jgi:DNA-binding XRE family transcriptional regulator